MFYEVGRARKSKEYRNTETKKKVGNEKSMVYKERRPIRR